MTSQAYLNKKRVALIRSKGKTDDKMSSGDEDIVSEIMKSMESKRIISYKELENFRERQNSSNPEIAVPEFKQTKQFLPRKKHPLMEKCQKNLKYLKHNRSIPKQRAHVGEISFPKSIIKKANPITNSNSISKILNVKKKSQEKNTERNLEKVQKCNFKSQNKEKKFKFKTKSFKSLSPSSVPDNHAAQVPKDISDSDCDFEEFIREQKDLLECEDGKIKSTFRKRKKKKQKEVKYNRKRSKTNKHKKHVNEKSEDETLTLSDIDKKSEETSLHEKQATNSFLEEKSEDERLSDIDKNSEVTSLGENQATTSALEEKSEESDYEANESFCFDSDSSDTNDVNPHLELNNNSKSDTINYSFNSNLILDLTKTDAKNYISKNFSCIVRLERNQSLDEKVISSLTKETSKDDLDLSSNENQSKLKYDISKNNANHSSPIILDSDEEECMIICEVSPRSGCTSTISEKSRESIQENECNLSYVNSNNTIGRQDEKSLESRNSPEVEILVDTSDNTMESHDETEIQISFVESLNTPFCNNDNSVVNTQIFKEKSTLNENLNHIVETSDNRNIANCSENKTALDSILFKKDFFKYAKTYSEPQNLIDINAQVIPEANKKTDFIDPKINECLQKIDLKLINSTLKQASSVEYLNNCDNVVLGKTIPKTSIKCTNYMDFNCDSNVTKLPTKKILNDACIQDINPLPSHVLEIAQKIDFKEVLTITKQQPNRIDSSFQSIKDLSTYTDSLMKNSTHQSTIAANSCNSRVLSPNESNNLEKLALHHALGAQKLDKSMSELTDTFKIKMEKFIESPSDELDVIATANILDLDEHKSKDFLPLFNLYIKELTKYKKIKSAEQNVSEGLKILEETQFEKLKYLDKAIQSVLQRDPCSLKIVDKTKFSKPGSSLSDNNLSLCKQETLNSNKNQSTSEDTKSFKQKAQICNNCGVLAKLKCLGCGKVFFCSEKCGLKFWKEGHASSCQKDDSSREKIENRI